MAGKSAAVPKPLANVKGRTAFVTGGSSGIGLGIAARVVRGRHEGDFHLQECGPSRYGAGFLSKGNAGVHAILLDTTDREGMVRAADEAERVFGNVHLLGQQRRRGRAGADLFGCPGRTGTGRWM